MRFLICWLMVIFLASCALLEPQSEEPEAVANHSQSLIDGFQALHQDQPKRALEHFDATIAATHVQEPVHTRALLGKAMIHLHEQSPWRDLDQSERYIEQVEGQLAAIGGLESISDWVLRTTAIRLLEAERRIEAAERRLASLDQVEADLEKARERAARADRLEQELAKTRTEKEQAEETIARLRNLIMDE